MCGHGRNPHLTMSLRTYTTLPLPSGTPPCRLSMPTHMRASPRHWHRPIWRARKMPMLAILLTSVLRRFQKWMLWAMTKFSESEALLTKQTVAPSSQWVYPRHCRRHCFGRRRGGGLFLPHCCRRHDVHIIVILIIINFFFSNFNDVDLLRSMLADCCMPRRQEWGTMAAVGGLRPPWLACVYFA